MLHHPTFLEENPCRTWITNPHLGTAGSDNNSLIYLAQKCLPSKLFCHQKLGTIITCNVKEQGGIKN